MTFKLTDILRELQESTRWTGYHLTDEESAKNIMKEKRFNNTEVWLAPDDTGHYGDWAVLVSTPQETKPFVMDKYYRGNFDIEKNRKYYDSLGGEANPKTFNTLRNEGYDVVIEDNGDRGYLYPEKLEIVDIWELK